MNRNSFIQNKSDWDAADDELLKFKTAHSILRGFEELKILAEKANKHIADFERKLESVVRGMPDIALLQVGESDLLESTFNYNDDYTKISMLLHKIDRSNPFFENDNYGVLYSVM